MLVTSCDREYLINKSHFYIVFRLCKTTTPRHFKSIEFDIIENTIQYKTSTNQTAIATSRCCEYFKRNM